MAVFFSYALQFYVPIDILWPILARRQAAKWIRQEKKQRKEKEDGGSEKGQEEEGEGMRKSQKRELHRARFLNYGEFILRFLLLTLTCELNFDSFDSFQHFYCNN